MERPQESGLNPMPSLHEQAMAIVERTPELRPHADAVIKEMMHHHILRALNDLGLFSHLTFIGGTCLHLCHGCARFSEDLDFRGGSVDRAALRRNLAGDLQNALADRRIEAEVRGRGMAQEQAFSIDRWWVKSRVREDARRDQKSVERIKIEIDSRPASAGRRPTALIQRFGSVVGEGLHPALVPAATVLDIASDKVLALPDSLLARPDNPRHRDVWDLAWALPKLALSDLAATVAGSIDGPDAAERVLSTLESARPLLRPHIESDGFRRGLRPFLTDSAAEETIDSPIYRTYMGDAIEGAWAEIVRALQSQDSAPPPPAVAEPGLKYGHDGRAPHRQDAPAINSGEQRKSGRKRKRSTPSP